MMDIGSLICTHKNPNCSACPFNSKCQGKENPLLYPEKRVKKIKPIRQRFMIIYHHDNNYALSQNETKLLSGLWGFYQTESFGIDNNNITKLGDFTHHYTHFRLNTTVLLVHEEKRNRDYFSFEEIDNLALSGADRKALILLKAYRL
jgi:A/G-specific adenine glycosylase